MIQPGAEATVSSVMIWLLNEHRHMLQLEKGLEMINSAVWKTKNNNLQQAKSV